MKRILIFSLAYHPVIGGAEVAVKNITDRIDDIEFHMVTHRFEGQHPSEEKIGNVVVHRISSSKTTFPIDAFLFAKKLHKEQPFDAIWSIMAARAGGAALFFKLSHRSVPYVLTLQEGDPIEYMKRRSLAVINPFFKKIFTHADLIQPISNYLSDYARAMGARAPIVIIPNGVDAAFFERAPEPAELDAAKAKLSKRDGDVFLITTSRLVKKNGVGDIIASLAHLPEHYKLAVVGTGELETELELEAKHLDVDGRVVFLGHMPHKDIPAYLHVSDIFVRPSLAEGFGNSFIEAMAAGLPVIATPVGGIVDFLKDGETGVFCQVEDPQSIAEQVKRLEADPKLRSRLVDTARAMVKEKYDWNLIAREMRSRVFGAI